MASGRPDPAEEDTGPASSLLEILHMGLVHLLTTGCIVLAIISVLGAFGCSTTNDQNSAECESLDQSWTGLMIALPLLGMLIGPRLIDQVIRPLIADALSPQKVE